MTDGKVKAYVCKEGIKQRTSKQNTDVLAILKRQYEQALLSAMQNVQLTPTVETFELRDCTVDPAYRSPLCYDEYLEGSSFDPDNMVKETFNSSSLDDIKTIMSGKTGKAPYSGVGIKLHIFFFKNCKKTLFAGIKLRFRNFIPDGP